MKADNAIFKKADNAIFKKEGGQFNIQEGGQTFARLLFVCPPSFFSGGGHARLLSSREAAKRWAAFFFRLPAFFSFARLLFVCPPALHLPIFFIK
ncbi:MAG: hypothetical protein Q8Q23_02145 [bacterium]|nr:hypothetical protein [bacterium]